MAKDLRLLPQNLEAERAVLGAVLVDAKALDRVVPLLSPDSFYKDSHALIYQSMVAMLADGQSVDMVTLTDYLRKQRKLSRAGGAHYLTGLPEAVVSAANVEHYAKIVRQKHVLRETIRAGSEMINLGFSENLEGGGVDLGEIESRVMDLLRDPKSGRLLSLKDIDKDVWAGLEWMVAHPGTFRGYKTSFHDVDRLTGGLPKGEVIIIAARPRVGKTSMMLTIAANLASDGRRVGIISLEMPRGSLYQRLLFQVARMNAHAANDGSLTRRDLERLNEFRRTLRDLPIFIVDGLDANLSAVLSAARQLWREKHIEVLAVDYLQLIEGGGRDMRESTTRVSRAVKGLALQLDIPILLLSQLNREPESRKGAKPRLSDLGESGAVERDADQVWLLWRPELAGLERDGDNDYRGKVAVLLDKNRSGPMGACWLAFEAKYAGFENLSHGGQSPGGANGRGR